jgi:hypothetical protein
MTRRMADDRIQFRAAALRIVAARDAHHAVAVHEPGSTELGVSGRRETARETDERRVDVAVRQTREIIARVDLRVEFCGHLLDIARNRPDSLGIAPLHDIIVLNAHDRKAVEVSRAHKSANVGDMQGRERGCQFDHDTPAG